MFFRILKKDFKRKRSMNIILLVFVILATTFLASSMNNLIAISRSTDYFVEKAKTPDYIISAYDRGGNTEIDKWLDNSKFISSYEIDKSVILSKDSIKIKRSERTKKFIPNGQILLQAQPKKYGKVLDVDGRETHLKSGEVAFSMADKNKNNLKLGDKVVITLGDIKKTFTVKKFIKDAIFGSSVMDMKRVIISDEDYKTFKEYKGAAALDNYYIMSKDTAKLDKEFKRVNCNTIINFDKSMIHSTFVLDMMPSALLIIVSFCLILIAFLILRFTIVFTLQDDFKEIGVMKAIGLKGFNIKKIYLIKYLAITILGAAIGFGVSFPFGSMLLNQSQGNILMEESTGNILVNIACSFLISLIVLLFCYTCTRKLDKFSAIDAIRNGSNGESFNKVVRLRLKSFNKLNVPIFIALNDILCNFRRFAVLILTFCIGTILIVVPLNTINTLKDGNIIKVFGLEYSDVLLETNKMDKYIIRADKEEYLKDMRELTQSFRNSGVDIKLYGEVMYRLKFYAEDKNNVLTLMTSQTLSKNTDHHNILKGKMPKFENEVAITEAAAKKLKLSIGDTVHIQIGNGTKELIVTGLYESMTNMGQSARVSPKLDISFKHLAIVMPFQGDFRGKQEPKTLINKLKHKYPSYSFKTPQQYVSRYLGSSMKQIDSLKNLIVMIVLCINALITVLMMKTFITKEKGEIAMLKSVGFRNSVLRLWQAARISIVLITAIILGVLLSKFLGPLTAGQVFAIMGVHNIVFKVKPLEVYLIYPAVLLVITTAIAYLSARAVNKVDLKEINNME